MTLRRLPLPPASDAWGWPGSPGFEHNLSVFEEGQQLLCGQSNPRCAWITHTHKLLYRQSNPHAVHGSHTHTHTHKLLCGQSNPCCAWITHTHTHTHTHIHTSFCAGSQTHTLCMDHELKLSPWPVFFVGTGLEEQFACGSGTFAVLPARAACTLLLAQTLRVL